MGRTDGQLRLADPCHALDRGDHDGGLRSRLAQPPQLGLPAGELGDVHRQLAMRVQSRGRGHPAFEDHLLQLAQPRARLDADLLDHVFAGRREGLQRLAATARAIQRQHQLRPELLAQRVQRGLPPQPVDHVVEPAEFQRGPGEPLDRGETAFLDPGELGAQQRSRVELGGRDAVPPGQRLTEEARGRLRVVVRQGGLALADELVERVEVQLAGFDHELVAVAGMRDQPVTEDLAQPGDVRAQVRLGRHRRRIPDRLRQLCDADRLVRVQQQHGEHRALPGSAQLQHCAGPPYRQRTEQQELHGYIAPR